MGGFLYCNREQVSWPRGCFQISGMQDRKICASLALRNIQFIVMAALWRPPIFQGLDGKTAVMGGRDQPGHDDKASTGRE
jgi:hypothetical protein